MYADFQFECLRRGDLRCFCRTEAQTGIRKCDVRPLVGGLVYDSVKENLEIDGRSKVVILPLENTLTK